MRPLLARAVVTDPVSLTDTPNFQASVKRSVAFLVQNSSQMLPRAPLGAILTRPRDARPSACRLTTGFAEPNIGAMVAGPYNSVPEQRKRLSAAQSRFWKELDNAKGGAWMAGLVVVLFAVPDLLVFDFHILTSKYFFVYYVWPGIPLLYYLFKVCFIALRRPLGTLTCDRCQTPFYLGETWICGHCETRYNFLNDIGLAPTFLEHCRHHECKRLPHSLWCYRCEQPIIFDQSTYDGSPKESAYLAGYPPTEQPRQGPSSVP